MASENLFIRPACIRWFRTKGDRHCLYRALSESYEQPLTPEEIWALRGLLSKRVHAMSTRSHQSGLSLKDHIWAEHKIGVDDYCKRRATTEVFGGPHEIEAYVEEKGGAFSVRIWTEVFLNGEKLLREMTHHRGNADASVIELLWSNGGDAAAGKEGADHYQRFEWEGVRQPPLSTPR